MGSLPELSLESTISSRNIGDFAAQFSGIYSEYETIMKLECYISRLEDEMKKINAFKNELPLVALLVEDVIARLKDDLACSRGSNPKPVLEEFIPPKSSSTDEVDEKIDSSKENCIINNIEKMNWMSCVQLWNSGNQHHHPNTDLNNNKKMISKEVNKLSMMDNLFKSGENRTVLPFKGCPNFSVIKEEDELVVVPMVSLCTPEIKNSRFEINPIGFRTKSNCCRSDGQSNLEGVQPQTSRKQRRCWSPELNRRFVNALQQLGGGRAATPKQIRELMQVDGLTNDEVKSHLQKYRLSKATPKDKTSKIQLGDLWVSQEQCHDSSKSESDSPQGPGFSRCTSITGVDSMEDEEHERSKNHSWKSHIKLCDVANV